MKKKYDNTIVKMKDDFRLVVDSILKKLFEIDTTYSGVNRIYVDLNSALSILFRYEDITDDELLNITGDVIETFIRTHLEKGITLYLMYNLKPSAVHRHICKEWCKEREERVSILKSDYIKKLLVTFKVYSNTNNNLKIVNCKDIHPAMVVYQIDKLNISSSLVLSRDAVFRCLIKSNIAIYNGVDWIEFSNANVKQPNGIELIDPLETLAYYYILNGDIRNEYKGYPGYGVVKSVRYINSNRLKIRSNKIDHPLKAFIDEHLGLYDIHKMLKIAEELKLDLNAYNNL